MPFDSVCMNDECIKRRISFFEFDTENEHITNSHNVKSIHPLTYVSYFSKDDKVENARQEINGQLICAELERFRDEAFQAVVEAIRVLFYDSKIFHCLQKQLPVFQAVNIKALLTKLSHQDYTLLEHLKLFEMQKKQKNFKNYLSKSIKELQQQVKVHFSSLKKGFLETCSQLQDPNATKTQKSQQIEQSKLAPQIQKPHQQQIQPRKSQQQQRKPSIVSEPMKEISVKLQYIQRNSYTFRNDSQSRKNEQMDYEDDDDQQEDEQNDNDNIQKSEAQAQKNKPIVKQPSQSKSIKRRRKNYILTDGIEILSQKEVIINQSKYPLKTLAFLQQKFPLLTTVHIFHQAMARQTIIKKMLETFPKMKRITLNCIFEFEPKIFNQVSKDILSTLSLQLKWDMSNFFTEYYAFQYFPFRSLKRMERVKPINIEQLFSLIPNNNSVWDCDSSSRKWLNKKLIRYSAVTAMRFDVGLDDYNQLTYNNLFRNIRVLVFSDIYMGQNTKAIQFIKINAHIETIILNKCSMDDKVLNSMLKEMQNLLRLQKLSLTGGSRCYNQINPHILFGLVSLTHLNVQSYLFLNEKKEKSFANLKDISKLTNLKYLSLYYCGIQQKKENTENVSMFFYSKPFELIESEVLMYLSLSSINSLLYLNLGKTNIDNAACQSIKKMTSLKYLNIDETRIQGEALIDAFKHMALQNFLGTNLRYLSIQRKTGERQYFTSQHLQQLSKYLLKLVYINIAFLQQITDYSFSDFKNLKTIALSEGQFNYLDLIISPEINRYKIK